MPEKLITFLKFGLFMIVLKISIVYNKGLTEKLDYKVELFILISKTAPRQSSKEEEELYIKDCIGGCMIIPDILAYS